MVGEPSTVWGGLLIPCLEVWKSLPAKGRRLDPQRPQDAYLHGIGRDFYQLALMDLFGLLAVAPPPQPVAPWTPARIRHVPFGDAILNHIAASTIDPLQGDDPLQDEDEAAPVVPRFGALQPLFQPYFPEWRDNLEFPDPEPREGLFVFRVSLGKIWRLIAIPADATLEDLVPPILRSVNFDSDHLYEFAYRDRLGAMVSVLHPAMDGGPWADQTPIGTLPLEPGQSMQLMYDFGDNWRFDLRLERIEPPGSRKARSPRILESHGKAPPQYPNWDD